MNSFPSVIVNFGLSYIIEPKQLTKFYFLHAGKREREHRNPKYEENEETELYVVYTMRSDLVIECFMCVECISVFSSSSIRLPVCRFRMHKYLIFYPLIYFFLYVEPNIMPPRIREMANGK